jgi:CubicO group peptidase (beta-lactamase class C family)
VISVAPKSALTHHEVLRGPVIQCAIVAAALFAPFVVEAVAPGDVASPLDSGDVGAFFDGLLPYAMQRGAIPGAVVVVVKDGSVLFAKGYGYADTEAHKPVDPATTLFRPGSISKTITWTAVMQLVEAGKIDLNRNINDYLDFHIPDTWPNPVTMLNLMTHTAGFEDVQKNIAFTDGRRAQSNEQFLKAWIPERIFRPGQVFAYSNYGAALAGYIVQRVSGEPFEQYAQRHIFTPLGMDNTTFLQPVPAKFAADVARGYRAGSNAAEPAETIAPAPAGAMFITGLDMARFMLAHLQNGRLATARILSESAARRMHASAFQPSTALNGMALGFRREDRNGQTIIGHAGGTLFFHSDLHLFLDSGVGIFISMNGGGINGDADKLRQAVFEQFSGRYFQRATAAGPALATAIEHGRLAQGYYETTRRSDANFWSFADMLTQSAVTANRDGTISIGGLEGIAGKPDRWREVAPFVWREVTGEDRVAMHVRDRRVADIVAPPLYVLKPVPPWRSAGWNIPLLLASLFVLALGALQWPAAAVLRRVYGRAPRLSGADLTGFRLTRAVCCGNLIFIAGILVLLVLVSAGDVPLTDRIDGWLRLLQLFGWIGMAGALFAVYKAISEWRTARSVWLKMSESVVALACLSTVWFAIAFHLLSWDLHF